MNSIHKRRLFQIAIIALGLSISTGFILYALKKNINVFLTPSQLADTALSTDYPIRLGGIVKKDSVVREKDGLGLQFIITDFKHDVPVHFVGVLPDLFREGKGVIAEGRMTAQKTFKASFVLAKHDENYIPKKVYETMRHK